MAITIGKVNLMNSHFKVGMHIDFVLLGGIAVM